MTDEERDRRVFEIFARACSLAVAERPSALEQACAGDADLRRRVEAMLDADASADRGVIGSDDDIENFLTRQIRQVVPGADAALRADAPAVDGEYTILRVIGEGGMGTVYEAEQHQPRRRVAIKAIRPGRITPQMRKRFEYEAQVLARLEHPGIARLYESNTHSEGGRVRAFLAMELVLGEPIDAYATAHDLDIQQRLRLFMKVCDAVAYAHRMGVIHRDLKPANILINAEGEPKVLDFGVARTIAASADKLQATQLTHDGQIIGTLAYMSPQQVEGDNEVDTRADVYALGVILYKLLTGVLPIDVGDINLLVASKRLLTETPRPIGQRDRRLKGDLETIVARALEKEPAQRYGSVDQIRAEIDRHLSGRPIEARAHSTFYVVRKALWRHRELVGICLLLLGLLTAFGIYAAVQANRNRRLAVAANEARARATAQAGDLRRLLYFSHIGFAQSALENNDMERAHTLLDGCDVELRAWEWSYLERLCDLSSETTQLNLKRPRYASYTADRTRVAIATLDREVALRDNTGPAGGRELSRVEIPAGSARAAISRDGHWLAYGAVVDVVTLTDLRSGATRELKAPSSPPPDPDASNRLLRVLAFTDDARTLVAGGVDGMLRVWDVSSATLRRSIELPSRLPICMQLSPAGDWAAVGDAGGRLRLFDLRSGKVIRELKAHDAAIWSLALSPDRTRLASGDIDARIIIWDLATGRSVAQQDTNDGWITAMCFSPDGETVAMGRADSTIRLLHLDDTSTAGVLRGHRHAIVHVDWQPDGTLHTVSLDGTAKNWNAQSALQVPTIRTGQPQSVGLAFDLTGGRVLVGGSDGTVRSWTVPPAAHEQSVESAALPKHDGSVLEIVVDRTRGRVATTGRDGVVKMSSLRDDAKTPPRLITPNDGGISAIDFSPDGARLIIGSATRFSLWDVERGAKLREYADRTVANELSFAPDGRSFYLGGADGYVRRWRIDSETPVGEVKVDPVAGVYDVRVSPDGRTLAAAGDTETVALVDTESLEVIRRLVGHRGAVYGVAFHPSGKRLATCGSDRIIRIWDVESGTELITLRGHRGGIHHVQFSPDGRTLASSSDDGTVKLWRSLPR